MIKHLLMILIIVQFSLGQQTQEGAPYSQIQSLENNYHTITLPQVNNDVLLEEDTYRVIGTPYRYGYKHEVFYTPANFGTWNKTLEGGLLWQASFTSEDAYAISFEYKNFHIPEGGQLYVYTPDYEMIYWSIYLFK